MLEQLQECCTRSPIYFFVLTTVVWSYIFWSFLFLSVEPGDWFYMPWRSCPYCYYGDAIAPIAYVLLLVGGLGPSLLGIVATALAGGQVGVDKLWERFRNTGNADKATCWFMATLLVPTMNSVTFLIQVAAGERPGSSTIAARIVPGLFWGIATGLMEEFGWRGFLLPRLLYNDDDQRQQYRLKPIHASLAVGTIWGLLWQWYIEFFRVGGPSFTSFVKILLLGPVTLSAWSLLLTLLYLKTGGSLLLSVVMRASMSSSAAIFQNAYPLLRWCFCSSVVTVAATGVVWVNMRKSTLLPSPPPPRPPAQPRPPSTPASAPIPPAFSGAARDIEMAAMTRDEIVAALPTAEIASPNQKESCAICLEKFEVGRSFKTLPCFHSDFHTECVDEWLLNSLSCPICKCPLQ
jgi:membrane protease YdiL (CAAX protease family)